MSKLITLRAINNPDMEMFAIVDNDDYEKLSKHKWYCRLPSGYAIRCEQDPVAKKTIWFFMHRDVLSPEKGHEIDHINGNKIDNRKSNLRQVTRSQNNQNSKPRTNGSSKYKGVSFHKASQLWIAEITRDGNKRRLGYFETERQAAIAYNNAAADLFGEYARLNEIPDSAADDCVPVKLKKRRKSRFIGVYWDKGKSLWAAEVSHEKVRHFVGRFSSEELAAQERDRVAIKVQGEKAKLNFG